MAANARSANYRVVTVVVIECALLRSLPVHRTRRLRATPVARRPDDRASHQRHRGIAGRHVLDGHHLQESVGPSLQNVRFT